MTVRDIVAIGDPVLRTRAREVTRDELRSAEMQALIDDLIETKRAAHGAGLAANQVGVALRIAVAEVVQPNPRYPYKPEIPLTVVVSRAAPRTATDGLEAAGADVVVATGENEPARIRSALDQLGAAGISSLLLEGGPHLAGAFLDAGEVDEMSLFIAPVVIGGTSLFGGRGAVIGTIIGALIVYAFRLGLSLAGVDDQWRVFATGVLVIVAVGIDQWIRKVKA